MKSVSLVFLCEPMPAAGTLRQAERRDNMNFAAMSCEAFVEELASKAPVPGGGGASALVGAVGTALGNMVGSLTVGKKKYADVEEEMRAMMERCTLLQGELLALADRDAEVFAPLAAAYKLPQETPSEWEEKDRVMASVLKEACLVPLEIMEKCAASLAMMEVFASKGSVMAVSDAAAGAVLCGSALRAASLNVFINTKSMKNRDEADALNERADRLLAEYLPLADRIFEQVTGKLRPERA